MSETQQQPATTVPAQEKEQAKRPTGYRVEEEKRIEINKTHQNRRERAEVLKVISIGLFGRKRYRNIYLSASLNNFYYALMIANTLQKRVEKLALVISLEKVKYTEFADEGAQGVEKEYSTFLIKITRQPTEEDKKHPGFNEGLQKIENPLTEIIKLRTQRGRTDRKRVNRRNNYPRRQGEPRRRQGDDRRRQEKVPRQERRVERDDREGERRRPVREERREGQERRERRQGREGQEKREGQERRQGQERRYNERRGGEERDRRGGERRFRDEDYDRRPQQRYRQDKFEKVEDDEYRRGERKTRGGQQQRPQGRVAEHEYKREHLNRRNDEREDRRDRAPKNRYSSEDEY